MRLGLFFMLLNSELDDDTDRTVGHDLSTLVLKAILRKRPTEPCTFSGKNFMTGEDGFGEAYNYNLSYKGKIQTKNKLESDPTETSNTRLSQIIRVRQNVSV